MKKSKHWPRTVAGETYNDYKEYLHSEHWKLCRRIQLQKDNYRCAVCGATTGLHIHHIDYENMDNPNLITLCGNCHFWVHHGADLKAKGRTMKLWTGKVKHWNEQKPKRKKKRKKKASKRASVV